MLGWYASFGGSALPPLAKAYTHPQIQGRRSTRKRLLGAATTTTTGYRFTGATTSPCVCACALTAYRQTAAVT